MIQAAPMCFRIITDNDDSFCTIFDYRGIILLSNGCDNVYGLKVNMIKVAGHQMSLIGGGEPLAPCHRTGGR